MTTKNKTPEIRFKGFSGKWDEKELGDVVDVRSGRDYKHLLLGHIPVYGTGGYMLSVDEALSYDEDAIGIGRKGTIDKPYISNAPFWTVDTLFYAIPKEENYLYFTFDIFQNINWKQKDESTGVPSLSKVSINSISTCVPKFKEQTKIGNYFQQLDTLIARHQRKHKKLLQIKKSLLEKMFPKPGKSTPEIRFKGFNGKWDEKKLGELADFSKGQGYSKNDLVEEGNPIILYGRLYTKYQTVIAEVDTFALSVDKSIHSKGNEVIVPASGETSEDIARASAVVSSGVLLGGDLNIIYPNNKINSVFLALTISYGQTQKDLSRRAQGKSVVHVRNTDLKEIEIYYPCKKEQSQIGDLFKHLDSLIAQQQAQIEKVKQIKQACLAKMFV